MLNSSDAKSEKQHRDWFIEGLESELGLGRKTDPDHACFCYKQAIAFEDNQVLSHAYVRLAWLYESGKVSSAAQVQVSEVLNLYLAAIMLEDTAAPYFYACLGLAQFCSEEQASIIDLDAVVTVDFDDACYDMPFIFLALRLLKPFNGRYLSDVSHIAQLKALVMTVADDPDFQINRYCPVTTDHLFRVALATQDADIIRVFIAKKPNWHLPDSDHLSLYQRVMFDLAAPTFDDVDRYIVPISPVYLATDLREEVMSMLSGQYAASAWRVRWMNSPFIQDAKTISTPLLRRAQTVINKTRSTIILGPENKYANSMLRTGGWATEVANSPPPEEPRCVSPGYYQVFDWAQDQTLSLLSTGKGTESRYQWAYLLCFLAVNSIVNNFRVGNCETMNMLVFLEMAERACVPTETVTPLTIDYIAADGNQHFFVMINADEAAPVYFIDPEKCGGDAFIIDAYHNVICSAADMTRQQRHRFSHYDMYKRVLRLRLPDQRDELIAMAQFFNQTIQPKLEAGLRLTYPNIRWLVEKSNLADLSLTCKDNTKKAFTLG